MSAEVRWSASYKTPDQLQGSRLMCPSKAGHHSFIPFRRVVGGTADEGFDQEMDIAWICQHCLVQVLAEIEVKKG